MKERSKIMSNGLRLSQNYKNNEITDAEGNYSLP